VSRTTVPFSPASSLLRAARATWDYDGACPRGVRDREHDEQWAGPAGERVCGFDITGQDEQLRALGIDPRRVLTERHVLDEHRQIRSELDAYIRLLERVPWLKPLAWRIGRPWIRPWLARLYHWGVQRRLHRSGRPGRAA